MKKILACLFFTVLLATLLNAADQSWINNSLTMKIDSRFSVKFTNEIKYDELTFRDSLVSNWQSGIVYRFSKKVYVAAVYKRETTEKTDYNLNENRFTLEAGWKTSFHKSYSFSIRFRTEIRTFEDDLSDNHLRFRLRLKFSRSVKIGKLKISPFIAIEPFGDTKNDEINRYRFYAGTKFSLTSNLSFTVNYVLQGTRHKDKLHVINSGFALKF